MTTTQLTENSRIGEVENLPDPARWRNPVEDNNTEADDLRLLALEIIMHDPELAKQLVRAGVNKVLSDSPSAHG